MFPSFINIDILFVNSKVALLKNQNQNQNKNNSQKTNALLNNIVYYT